MRDIGVHAHQVTGAQRQRGTGRRRKQAHRKVRQRQGDGALDLDADQVADDGVGQAVEVQLAGHHKLGERILHGFEGTRHRAFGLLGGVGGVLDIGAQGRLGPELGAALVLGVGPNEVLHNGELTRQGVVDGLDGLGTQIGVLDLTGFLARGGGGFFEFVAGLQDGTLARRQIQHLALQLQGLDALTVAATQPFGDLAGGRFFFFVSVEGLVGGFLPLDGFEHLDVLLGLRRHPLVALGLDLQGARTQLRRFAFLSPQEPGAKLVEEGLALIGFGGNARSGKGAQIQIGGWPGRSGQGRQEAVVDGLNFPGLRFGVEHEPLAHNAHRAALLVKEAGHAIGIARVLVDVE